MIEKKHKELRWGSGSRSETSDARERLIQAAQKCYREKGIKQTTINDIAAAAKITRRTVYRHFSSHDEILLAVFERVVDSFWEDLYRDITLQGDFGDSLPEALLYSINYAKTTERHGYMFANDAQAITNDIYISNFAFIEASQKGLQQIYALKLSQGLAASDLNIQMIAEWFNRLILSFLSTPSQIYQDDKQLLALFKNMLSPINCQTPPP